MLVILRGYQNKNCILNHVPMHESTVFHLWYHRGNYYVKDNFYWWLKLFKTSILIDNFLSTSISDHERELGFSLVLDMRGSTWPSVKPMLKALQVCFTWYWMKNSYYSLKPVTHLALHMVILLNLIVYNDIWYMNDIMQSVLLV